MGNGMKQEDIESLNNLDHLKICYIPPYDLTVPADKVKEIKLSKPLEEVFWIDLI